MRITDKPLAAVGLTSYRCKSGYDWIMIGAKTHKEAMNEARRSSEAAVADDLQVWDGEQYVTAGFSE